MKKTTSLILALLFSGVMLLGEAINTNTKAAVAAVAVAKLCCDALSGCGSTECCAGRGTPSGCVMICDSGAGIVCPKAEVVVAAADAN